MNKKKVIVIEDDKFLLKLYCNKLKNNGFEAIGALTSDEGINRIIAENPDLIILDLVLPGKSGFEVLAEIKLNPKIKKIPIIILSNLSQDSDIKEAMELGANEYIVKTEVSVNLLPEIAKEILVKSKKK